MTWPFRTMLLKSAPSQAMVPDTCVPTWTVVTACRVPVAETVARTSPTVIAASLTDAPVMPAARVVRARADGHGGGQ